MLSREDIKQLNGFFDVKKLVQIIIPVLEPYSEDFAVEPHETTCGCCLGDSSCPCTYEEGESSCALCLGSGVSISTTAGFESSFIEEAPSDRQAIMLFVDDIFDTFFIMDQVIQSFHSFALHKDNIYVCALVSHLSHDELSKRHPKSRIIFAEKTHGEWIKFPYETENEPE